MKTIRWIVFWILLIGAVIVAIPTPITVGGDVRNSTGNGTDTVNITIQDWVSVKEVREYVKSTGIPDRPYQETTNDCDDFAYQLYEQALSDNRTIGLFVVMKYTDRKLTLFHMKNFVVIGNKIYQVEPQTGNTNPLGGWDARID